jgi:hypothetical protein
MHLYLVANTSPYIAYVVRKLARFSHNPKNSNALAIKRILSYLKSSQGKGMYMSPDEYLSSLVMLIQILEDYLGPKIP